jgi:hypothetical protein
MNVVFLVVIVGGSPGALGFMYRVALAGRAAPFYFAQADLIA